MNISDFQPKEQVVTLGALSEFSATLIPFLSKGMVLGLKGDMGAGKTTFVSSLAAHYGAQNVSSPTFALVNIYEGDLRIYHLDLYRLEDEASLFSIDIDRYLHPHDGISLIEWPERLGRLAPVGMPVLSFAYDAEESRRVSLLTT
ncbi:MAG: tRNA (adenosine(37)-N6)-threonylcarbamoyltransferase complex ATPase subunit type 1 TsaE [Actinobacteria bacterium]|nr:tRNA (adenosine(37)-N6)-threonylcarbamoyltransferase complex ATPase subunit type 1 TsaE [Actinomycetota bacterium]